MNPHTEQPIVAPRGRDADLPSSHPDLTLYRRTTLRMLRHYMRMAIEVGRLPSILGREFFRAKISHRQALTFEDAVILVHDVEKILSTLDAFDEQVVALMALQEYSQAETANLLGCARRTVGRRFPEVLDRISELLLAGGLLRPIHDAAADHEAGKGGEVQVFDVRSEHSPLCAKPCQEGDPGEDGVTDSEETENVFWEVSQNPTESVIL
jgi:predicted DNA-binding protein (UPF0251 family)